MSRRDKAGITLVEVLVIIVIIFVLWSLAMPAVSNKPGRGQMTQSLSNMKQLHLATQQMALDGATNGNTNLGWPGDTGSSFSNWAAQIVKGGYMRTNDLCKLLTGPGRSVPLDKIPTTNNTAVLVYAASTNSPASTVFLSTANFTNTPTGGEPLSKKATPYGDKGFVVFRIGGDGSVLHPRHIGKTNIIGAFVQLCR